MFWEVLQEEGAALRYDEICFIVFTCNRIIPTFGNAGVTATSSSAQKQR